MTSVSEEEIHENAEKVGSFLGFLLRQLPLHLSIPCLRMWEVFDAPWWTAFVFSYIQLSVLGLCLTFAFFYSTIVATDESGTDT